MEQADLIIGRRVRVELVRESAPLYDTKIEGPQDVVTLLQKEASRWDREHFLSVLLDHKHVVLGIDEVSVGTLGASLVHPREVFKSAILANAAAIIITHNHPSGDPTPSGEDMRITQKLVEAGETLGIPCIDHVILGRDAYNAWNENKSAWHTA